MCLHEKEMVLKLYASTMCDMQTLYTATVTDLCGWSKWQLRSVCVFLSRWTPCCYGLRWRVFDSSLVSDCCLLILVISAHCFTALHWLANLVKAVVVMGLLIWRNLFKLFTTRLAVLLSLILFVCHILVQFPGDAKNWMHVSKYLPVVVSYVILCVWFLFDCCVGLYNC